MVGLMANDYDEHWAARRLAKLAEDEGRPVEDILYERAARANLTNDKAWSTPSQFSGGANSAWYLAQMISKGLFQGRTNGPTV